MKYYDDSLLCEEHGKYAEKILNKKYNWNDILKKFIDKYFM